jgi:GNAT superfamily N-acetyltransferase
MVPFDGANPLAARHVRRIVASDAVGLLALRHALWHGLPGLWADDPVAPRTVLLVRDGDGRLEAFGAGAPGRAVRWLVAQGAAVALAAPESWRPAVAAGVRGCQCGTVITSVHDPGPGTMRAIAGARRGGAAVRPLAAGDEAAFRTAAPAWALRGWTDDRTLIDQGAACGVPHAGGFAALAWVFDATERYDALAVFTAPAFRRLGLGRASARALLDHVRRARRKVPLWSASADNTASLALAASLGFVPRAEETVLRWPAQPAGTGERGTVPAMM